jgi:GNAT superfamily N-acetyltransferase
MPAPRVPTETGLPPAVAGPSFLRDGTEVWVRPVRADDDVLVRAFVRASSFESLEERYFAGIRPSVAEAEIVTPGAPESRLCLLALGQAAGEVAILGVGEYVRCGPASSLAEVAFLVAEGYRGRGVASLLLARLARAARAFGIARFAASVRPENPEMLEVFHASGFPYREERLADEIEIVFPIGPPEPSPSDMRRAHHGHAPRHAAA